MKIILSALVFVFFVLGLSIYFLYPTLYGIKPDNSNTPRLSELKFAGELKESTESSQTDTDIPTETIIAEGLDTPWAIAFLPSGDMLVTERKGTVKLVDKQSLPGEPGKSGKVSEVATIANAKEIGEGGLLGMVLHPKFSENSFVYFYYTFENQGDNTKNRVVRMKYQNGQLSGEEILLDNIPGASNHNGGRIKFGPDNYLYITTGDAQEPSLAQEKMSDAGKILRVNPETGEGVAGNLENSQVYSYGHRNPQGIAWDISGNLWETEHGPSGGSLGTGNDEVNFIESGKNYGWPEIQADQIKLGMTAPIKYSTPSVSWAPGGTAIIDNILYFSGLRGQALYKAEIQGNKLGDLQELFKGKYGRIREVIAGPDGMLYISTSNRDGRGVPGKNDDRIIRINPKKL